MAMAGAVNMERSDMLFAVMRRGEAPNFGDPKTSAVERHPSGHLLGIGEASPLVACVAPVTVAVECVGAVKESAA
ncbi:hypothetical protein [Variovorax sp. PAMC26660]|uniref:hypothetical protein n=1 Tax=Variovorax sp. PAMC26660 TaxID=2762322 RepID=UPI00164DF804|nr:hypothetical protein [Variovorax sp. PAMC26660]QNK70560.1 hypothetical protein H7F35_13140 [Variovorax sp. PAMC26660]